VLDHLTRYGITTRAILERVIFRSEAERESFTNVIHRALMEKGLIKSEKLLGGPRVYYQLTEEGAAEADAPPESHKALNPTRFVELYGELLFCCPDPVEEPPRPKFTTAEFNHWFPDRLKAHQRLPGPYFLDIDKNGVRRLGRIVVDTTKNLLLHAAETALAKTAEFGGDFLEERRFTLAVVCQNPGSERTALTLLKDIQARGVRVTTTPCRDLVPMLAAVKKSPAAGKASAQGLR
jgi:hypothetical protein